MHRWRVRSWGMACALALVISIGLSGVSRADTVASLLGNFTINQYCGLKLANRTVDVHYTVVYGQLPALRELHAADADGNGVTSQDERNAYVGKLAPGYADAIELIVDGVRVPLRAVRWSSSLPTEQGGFSLRVDVDLSAALPMTGAAGPRTLRLSNSNFAGRMGWHEIVVEPASGIAVFDTDAYSTSATAGLTDALQSLPESGPLDERAVHMNFDDTGVPAGATGIVPRPQSGLPQLKPSVARAASADNAWIARQTRQLVDTLSGPRLEPRVAVWALLAALLLGAVHALSPGHGKTIVGAYLIGSRGTPRHALFLGFTVTVTHTLGVFLLGFATLYASRYVVPEKLFPILSLISALLVVGMGVVLLVQRSRGAFKALGTAAVAPGAAQVSASADAHATAFVPLGPAAGGARRHALLLDHGAGYGLVHAYDGTWHSHGGGKPHSHLPPGASGERVTWRSLLALGISGGLVPCPSAMVLLLAAVALNKTAFGMILVLIFSLGLAITLSAVGLIFLYARNRFGRPHSTARWPLLLPIASAVTITLVGIALCLSALRTFGN